MSATTGARSRVASHAGITFAGLMLANVLGYAFYALVSRSLGVESYGTFSSLVAIVLILSAPALIGQMVVAKLAADFALDELRLSGLVAAVDRVTIVVALAGGSAFAALSVPIAYFLHIGDPLLVTFAGLALCGAVALPFLRGVLQGTASFRGYALSNVAENLSKAVLAPVLGLFYGLRGAMLGLALGYACAAAFTFVAASARRVAGALPFSLRSVVRTSAAVALAVVCLNVLLLYDVVLAKRYLDAHTAGLYGAAALASRALYAVVAFVPTVLLPQAAGQAARGERTRYLFAQAFGVTALLCTAACVLFAFAPRFVIVVIAGRAFAGGAPLLPAYVIAVAALAAANVVATYNIARSRLGFVAPLALVAAGEIIAVVVRHRTAADLLQTIVVGHLLALVACATALGGRGKPPERAKGAP